MMYSKKINLVNNYRSVIRPILTHTYIYTEGNNIIFSGHLGINKLKHNKSALIVNIKKKYIFFFCSLYMNINHIFFFKYHLNYKQLIYMFKLYLYGITFGYSKRFKFESRLYRTKFSGAISYWQLAIAKKLHYTLPLGLDVHKKGPMTRKFWWVLIGNCPNIVSKHVFIFRSFRVPDNFSKLGIFVKDYPFVFLDRLKRIRV